MPIKLSQRERLLVDLHQRAKDCVDAIEVACGVFFGVETAEWRDACLILTTEFIAISDSARQEAATDMQQRAIA